MRQVGFLAWAMLLCIALVSATPDYGIVHYGSGQLNVSKARFWDGSQAGSEFSAGEGSGAIHWIASASSPKRQEHITVEVRDGGVIVAKVFRQSLFASKVLTTDFSSIASGYQGATVAYEQQSGRALVVYANDSDTAVYEIWNGTQFIGGGSQLINDSCRGIPRWLRSASNPLSNEIIVAELDTTASHCAQTWNGSEWTDPHFFVDTDLPSSVAPRMEIAYEQSSGDALAVFESDAEGAPRYARWENGAWTVSSSVPSITTDLVSWVSLASNPNNDDIALTAYSKSNSTATVGVWNGTAWKTFATIDSTIFENSQRPIDMVYLGITNNLLAAYTDADGTPKSAQCNGVDCLNGIWQPAVSLANVGNIAFLDLVSSKLTNSSLLAVLTDTHHERYLAEYTSSWSSLQFIGNKTNRNSAQDLALALDTFIDLVPPIVTNIIPSQGSNASSPLPVTILVDVDDFGVVDTVKAEVTDPAGSVTTFTLNNISGVRYNVTFTPAQVGRYNVTIIANDSAGNVNNTESSWFNYSHTAPAVSIIAPADLASFSNGTSVTFRGNATEVGGVAIQGSNLSWYSDIDGFMGTGANITRALSTAVHTITLQAVDSFNYIANASIMIEFFPDRDGDGLADNPDTLEGDESWVTTDGVEDLDVKVNNNTNISGIGYVGVGDLLFADGATTLLTFSHNFSITEIDLSTITLIVDYRTFIFSTTNEALRNDTKTIYITDYNFTNLCVKTTPVSSASQISDSCTGANELDFTGCLGGSATLSGITCTDSGSEITLTNLTSVGFKAKTPSPPPAPSGGSSGGGSRHSSGVSRNNAGSSAGGPRTTQVNNPNAESNNGGEPVKEKSQTVTPKAPEQPEVVPTPTQETHKTRSYWPWLLLVLGLLLFILSYGRKDKELPEEKNASSWGDTFK